MKNQYEQVCIDMCRYEKWCRLQHTCIKTHVIYNLINNSPVYSWYKKKKTSTSSLIYIINGDTLFQKFRSWNNILNYLPLILLQIYQKFAPFNIWLKIMYNIHTCMVYILGLNQFLNYLHLIFAIFVFAISPSLFTNQFSEQ